ncbi:hypothetical protein BCIN_02g08890 [Botrytis cinerea B05.10]|uniref:Tat pathway signal sequence protein n=1 Tax=Botryotinia fuckeliana (strain B05.10) TaxID=332648 RepID=A0A384JB07_BOTFB|nr:hypothetical protein BCIN_02g08890 [Botrytis cinerea B05.10]ATZ47631.1 hypothetical protein BCIN_02g08890 [Botrytis cinerea B05.10]
MWFPLITRHPIYEPVTASSDELAISGPHKSSKNKLSLRVNILMLVTLCFASCALGFLAARLLDTQSTAVRVGPRFAKELSVFSYNRNFSYPPSNITDAAWNGLFMTKSDGGFFNHPYVEDERATLSVLHQLHCLDGIRHIYYLNNHAATTGTVLLEEELELHMRRSHMRHCIDFLRQSLMCCGDSTIERVDPELKGVTGWGTEHVCTNWEELQEWVGERQRLDREG